MPTILEFAGAPPPKDVQLDGRSIAEILSNPVQTPEWTTTRPLYFFDNENLAAVRRELNWTMMRESLLQTMSACGVLLWVSFGATAMIGVYNLAGGPGFVRNLMTGLGVAPIVVILIMMAILVVLGCLMDWIGICLLTMPIFVPIIKHLGYDPVWFGVLFTMNMQISYLSPPFGPAAFYLKGVAPPEISLSEIFAALWPFMGLQAVSLAVVVLVSWGIAFVEYCFAVPANRIGSAVYSPAELKTIQEVITLIVFAGFTAVYFNEPLSWTQAAGFALIALGAALVFHGQA